MVKNPLIYVRHILEAIRNIEEDLEGLDFESFRCDRRARQLLERNLEIVSEASRRIPEDLKAVESNIPWQAVAGIGNVLRHDYHRTYPTILWETVNKDLKPLKAAVLRIGHSLDRQGAGQGKIERLRDALAEGEASGVAEPFDFSAFLREFDREIEDDKDT